MEDGEESNGSNTSPSPSVDNDDGNVKIDNPVHETDEVVVVPDEQIPTGRFSQVPSQFGFRDSMEDGYGGKDQKGGDPYMHNTKRFGKPVIVLEGVSKAYRLGSGREYVTALREVSLVENAEFGPIREGEFVMIRGKSGCGKTTMLNIMGTIDRPTGGSMYINGTKITKRSRDAFLAKLRLQTIGFVFQTFNLLSTLSALENVELPMVLLGKLSRRAVRKRATELLKSMGMQDRLGHLPSELSGGEQQRVTIARSLANDPPVMLLDEPTGSLATSQTIEIMNLLLDINRSRGVTMVMVSHNPDVECYADRILYVKDGRVVRQAVNDLQRKLDLANYLAYLATKEKESKAQMDKELREQQEKMRELEEESTTSSNESDDDDGNVPSPLTVELPKTASPPVMLVESRSTTS